MVGAGDGADVGAGLAAVIKKFRARSVPDFVKRLETAGVPLEDLDVLDPAVMPSTGTPEPGGLAWRDLLRLVREAAKRCRIRGFDVVELAPIPGVVAPDFLAAKLVYRIMGYLTEKPSDIEK